MEQKENANNFTSIDTNNISIDIKDSALFLCFGFQLLETKGKLTIPAFSQCT